MVNQELVDQVIRVIDSQGLSEATVSELRKSFDSTHFTYCMDDDVGEVVPFQQCEGFNIYLVDSADHCSVLTRDLESASGMVLAEVFDDE